jgi:hypothetical protein
MPLSTTFKLYRCGQFFYIEEPVVPGENLRAVQITDKLYYIMLYRVHLAMSRNLTLHVNGDRH